MKQFIKSIAGLVITIAVLSGFVLFMSTPAQADAPPSGCVIVHRGLGPENSITALAKAIRRGACGFETDVRFTRDNIGILNHDSTLNRTTNGTGRVTSRSWQYVSHLRIGHSHAHPGKYQQGLVLCRDSKAQSCMFEAKKGATPAQVLSMARDAVAVMGDKLYKLTIETDTYAQTRIIKNSEFKQVSVAFVGFNRWPSVSDVKASGANGIIVNRTVVSRARVASAARAGLWVTPYTVETWTQLKRVRHMGSHGAMTDSSRLIR
jgi:glycerophosphoryl diester phosphodiesterase